MSDSTRTPSGYATEIALSAWMAARARLLSDDPELAHDEALLVDLLGPETGEVHDILARLLRAAVHADSMAEAADERIAAMQARRDRYRRRKEAARATAFAILDALGERRVELPDMTASISASRPSVVIADETVIPEEYFRVTRAVDRGAISTAIKDGVIVPGAEMSNSLPTLTIRSR